MPTRRKVILISALSGLAIVLVSTGLKGSDTRGSVSFGSKLDSSLRGARNLQASAISNLGLDTINSVILSGSSPNTAATSTSAVGDTSVRAFVIKTGESPTAIITTEGSGFVTKAGRTPIVVATAEGSAGLAADGSVTATGAYIPMAGEGGDPVPTINQGTDTTNILSGNAGFNVQSNPSFTGVVKAVVAPAPAPSSGDQFGFGGDGGTSNTATPAPPPSDTYGSIGPKGQTAYESTFGNSAEPPAPETNTAFGAAESAAPATNFDAATASGGAVVDSTFGNDTPVYATVPAPVPEPAPAPVSGGAVVDSTFGVATPVYATAPAPVSESVPMPAPAPVPVPNTAQANDPYTNGGFGQAETAAPASSIETTTVVSTPAEPVQNINTASPQNGSMANQGTGTPAAQAQGPMYANTAADLSAIGFFASKGTPRVNPPMVAARPSPAEAANSNAAASINQVYAAAQGIRNSILRPTTISIPGPANVRFGSDRGVSFVIGGGGGGGGRTGLP